MCTISFVPTARGFRLAMNRDEKRTRVAALPPEIFTVGQRHAIYPREPSGGTWLAANDAGVCLALINWHRIEREPAGKIASRGRVIPSLIGASGVQQVAREIRELPLTKMRPFRLIVIDASENALREWRWDLRKLKPHRHRWQIQHWFSSGYDEAGADQEREKVCANRPGSLGEARRLRELHASHAPARGPFSICMHRSDAATVSYSEVVLSPGRITFRYLPGPPCRAGDRDWTGFRESRL